jgi:putative addiction module component (TIGR02574 family)
MASDLLDLEKRLLRLPSETRARLAERLIASLDDLSDEENERLWVDEAERRMQAFKAGRLSARPAEDVIREVRDHLR